MTPGPRGTGVGDSTGDGHPGETLMDRNGESPTTSPSADRSTRGDSEVIGLIAGNGRFPVLFAREAKARGLRIVAVAHRGETDPAIEAEVDELTWIRVGQLGKLLRTIKSAGATRAVMAGGIDKVRSLTQIRPDLRGVLFLRRAIAAGGHGDDSLLRALAAELEGQGVTIVPSTIFLENLMASPGLMAGPKPSAQALADIATGCRVLGALGETDVGQSVVVERGVVLAVEAVEGTDQAVLRAGALGRGGAVVVKTAKQAQDMRFDVPAVGPVTIETMTKAGATVLALESGSTLLLDRKEFVDAANRAGICVVGCSREGLVPGFSNG